MGSSKKKRKISNSSAQVNNSQPVAHCQENASKEQSNLNVKNYKKSQFVSCLQNNVHVLLENIEYIMKGHNSIHLSELPNFLYDVKSTQPEHISAMSDDSCDTLGLKIVNTFSLADANFSEIGQTSPDLTSLNDTGNENIILSVSDVSIPLHEPRDDDVAKVCVPRLPNDVNSSKNVDDLQPFVVLKEQEDSSNNCDDSNSVFSCSVLDSLLATETKALQNKTMFLLDEMPVNIQDIKYKTPSHQSGYVKTLETALKERKHRLIARPDTGNTDRVEKNTTKSRAIKKPIYNLSKARKALQKARHHRSDRDSADKAIISGLSNMVFKNRFLRSQTQKRSRSLLHDITLSMADNAASALYKSTDEFSSEEPCFSNCKAIGNIENNIAIDHKSMSKAQKFEDCRILVESISNDPLNMSPINNSRFSCLKRHLPPHALSPSKKRTLQSSFLQVITLKTAEFAANVSISNMFEEENDDISSDPLMKKFKKNMFSCDEKDIRKIKTTNKKLLRIRPISLNIAVAKYLVSRSRNQRSEQKLQDFKRFHFDKLPVLLKKKMLKTLHFRLQVSKHKLRWKEVKRSGDVLIFPESYSVPDKVTLCNVDIAHTTVDSLACARTHPIPLYKKKKQKRTRKKMKPTKLNSSTSLDTASLKDIQPGVMIVRLTPAKSNERKKMEKIHAKILSMCAWGSKAEDILKTIVESHFKLKHIQRGKYIRTAVDKYQIEVLRVSSTCAFDCNVPFYIRQQLDITPMLYVSLVRISVLQTSSTKHQCAKSIDIDFAEAIESMMQLDLELTRQYSNGIYSLDVKDIELKDFDASTNVNEKPLASFTVSPVSTPNINMLETFNSNVLGNLVQRFLHKHSVVKTTSVVTQKNFEVGKVGCLNKATSSMTYLLPSFPTTNHPGFIPVTQGGIIDSSKSALTQQKHGKTYNLNNGSLNSSLENDGAKSSQLTNVSTNRISQLPMLVNLTMHSVTSSRLKRIQANSSHAGTTLIFSGNRMAPGIRSHSTYQKIHPKPLGEVVTERNNFVNVLNNASLSTSVVQAQPLKQAYIAVPVKVLPPEIPKPPCLANPSNSQINSGGMQNALQLIFDPAGKIIPDSDKPLVCATSIIKPITLPSLPASVVTPQMIKTENSQRKVILGHNLFSKPSSITTPVAQNSDTAHKKPCKILLSKTKQQKLAPLLLNCSKQGFPRLQPVNLISPLPTNSKLSVAKLQHISTPQVVGSTVVVSANQNKLVSKVFGVNSGEESLSSPGCGNMTSSAHDTNQLFSSASTPQRAHDPTLPMISSNTEEDVSVTVFKPRSYTSNKFNDGDKNVVTTSCKASSSFNAEFSHPATENTLSNGKSLISAAISQQCTPALPNISVETVPSSDKKLTPEAAMPTVVTDVIHSHMLCRKERSERFDATTLPCITESSVLEKSSKLPFSNSEGLTDAVYSCTSSTSPSHLFSRSSAKPNHISSFSDDIIQRNNWQNISESTYTVFSDGNNPVANISCVGKSNVNKKLTCNIKKENSDDYNSSILKILSDEKQTNADSSLEQILQTICTNPDMLKKFNIEKTDARKILKILNKETADEKNKPACDIKNKDEVEIDVCESIDDVSEMEILKRNPEVFIPPSSIKSDGLGEKDMHRHIVSERIRRRENRARLRALHHSLKHPYSKTVQGTIIQARLECEHLKMEAVWLAETKALVQKQNFNLELYVQMLESGTDEDSLKETLQHLRLEINSQEKSITQHLQRIQQAEAVLGDASLYHKSKKT